MLNCFFELTAHLTHNTLVLNFFFGLSEHFPSVVFVLHALPF